MARKNRRRRDQNPKRGRKHRISPASGVSRVIGDSNYTHENSFDGAWHVRHITAWRAVKNYTCPGCLGIIPQGQPHVVVWRADWLMGDEDAGQQRRHWHTACWKNRKQDLR